MSVEDVLVAVKPREVYIVVGDVQYDKVIPSIAANFDQ